MTFLQVQHAGLKLFYALLGCFALMLAWPFVVSFSRLVLAGQLNLNALLWLGLGALSISASMLLFNSMRHSEVLSVRTQIRRVVLATLLVLPSLGMLLLLARSA